MSISWDLEILDLALAFCYHSWFCCCCCFWYVTVWYDYPKWMVDKTNNNVVFIDWQCRFLVMSFFVGRIFCHFCRRRRACLRMTFLLNALTDDSVANSRLSRNLESRIWIDGRTVLMMLWTPQEKWGDQAWAWLYLQYDATDRPNGWQIDLQMVSVVYLEVGEDWRRMVIYVQNSQQLRKAGGWIIETSKQSIVTVSGP